MPKQNIFDNETFFEGYKKIRENEANANNLFEIPALFSLLPELKGKTVLDLGCGFGEHCKGFVEKGAAKVVGIDISEKMLEVEEKFDLVVSSLAFHYVEDFDGVIKNIYNLLNPGGTLVFSQEHPLSTCFTGGERWTKDENNNKIHVNISNYCVEKENESEWFVENVKRYHRMFSTIVNTLIENGFTIQRITRMVVFKLGMKSLIGLHRFS